MSNKRNICIGKRGWQMLADRFGSKQAIADILHCSGFTVKTRMIKYDVICAADNYPWQFISSQEGFTSEYTMLFTFYWIYGINAECIGKYLGYYMGKYLDISRSAIMNRLRLNNIPIKKKGGSRYKIAKKLYINRDIIVKVDHENMALKELI